LGISLITILKPLVRLIGLARCALREVALSIFYFGVIGPLSLFHRRRRDAFKRRLSTWEAIDEGSTDINDHLRKL